ncbi:hypothetical protein [Deinococcus hohokamensis]|uniref:Uncharacterized protein n=1 Tax=Deinococcus hohokamensis TaxID=309883 RepID=A0ABV9I557_9DEIO
MDRNDDAVATHPTVQVIQPPHPIFEVDPDWLRAAKDFINANLVVPLVVLLVICLATFLLVNSYIQGLEFVTLITASLTALVAHQQLKK